MPAMCFCAVASTRLFALTATFDTTTEDLGLDGVPPTVALPLRLNFTLPPTRSAVPCELWASTPVPSADCPRTPLPAPKFEPYTPLAPVSASPRTPFELSNGVRGQSADGTGVL